METVPEQKSHAELMDEAIEVLNKEHELAVAETAFVVPMARALSVAVDALAPLPIEIRRRAVASLDAMLLTPPPDPVEVFGARLERALRDVLPLVAQFAAMRMQTPPIAMPPPPPAPFDPLETLAHQLAGLDPETLERGLALVQQRIAQIRADREASPPPV